MIYYVQQIDLTFHSLSRWHDDDLLQQHDKQRGAQLAKPRWQLSGRGWPVEGSQHSRPATEGLRAEFTTPALPAAPLRHPQQPRLLTAKVLLRSLLRRLFRTKGRIQRGVLKAVMPGFEWSHFCISTLQCFEQRALVNLLIWQWKRTIFKPNDWSLLRDV